MKMRKTIKLYNFTETEKHFIHSYKILQENVTGILKHIYHSEIILICIIKKQ